jgi:anti-sigma B factor antagonist
MALMSVEISVDEADGFAVVAVGGELDMSTAPELLTTAIDLIDSGRHRMILDLRDLTFCDSAGLSVIARLKRRVNEVDGVLILARAGGIVRSVLDLTGMTELIAAYPTIEDACTAAREWPATAG